ncbi:MAG: Imm61 family immunity protein [Actinomycetota bacterium]
MPSRPPSADSFDRDARVIAFGHGGSTGISRLVNLSHLVSHPLSDIIASYEDPEGRPLFRV